jgi:hypothetical protein
VATRFYLPSSGAAAVSPAFDSLWTVTGSADRLAMSTTASNTANLQKGANESVSGNADVLIRQYVGPNNLAAGVLTGTFRTSIRAEESNAAADMFLNLVVKVVSSDGSTVRGILYAGQGTHAASSVSTDPNYEFPVTPTNASRLLSGTLSSVTAQANDRLVVEYGYSDTNLNTTGRTGTLHFGDETADTDLPYTVDIGDNTYRPWFDFDFVNIVDAVTATATAAMLAPAVVTDVSVTVNAVAATATAQMLAPADTSPVPQHTTVQRTRNPLTVRIGDRHITREVSAVQFRKEAIGGVKSISLRLFRPLDRFDVDVTELAPVYLYDGRSATTLAEGKLSDLGRSASADGQTWDVVAFGPAQHAADRAFPYVAITQQLDFRQHSDTTKNATTGTNERSNDTPSLIISAEEGKTVSTSWQGRMADRVIRNAAMRLARVSCSIDSGVSDANYLQQLVTAADGGSDTTAASTASSTSTGSLTAVVVTDFPNGDDGVSIRVVRNTSADTGAENRWFEFWNFTLRAMLKDATGSNITTGYTHDYVLAHEIVTDLLGRVLDEFDGANATVATSATYQIDQLAYPDGVTAEQILNDLLLLEPAFRWYAKPDVTGNGYQFFWETLPTSVRYEVSLDDGGNFPSSVQELYNEVTVRWTDKDGRPRTTTRTLACTILDNAGVTRSTTIDLGDEIGSSAAATRAGDNFLADHNVPKNAGTLNVNRPIRDLVTGRMVEPFEIEPGELIRVRGIESYPDALNASSNDGLTVFRIWSVTYNSDGHTASLELDTDSRSTTNALRRLAKRRHRKR